MPTTGDQTPIGSLWCMIAAMRRLCGLLCLLLAFSACAVLDDRGRARETGSRAEPLEFTFQRVGGQGFIDQTLTMNNPAAEARAPTLRFTALDEGGDELTGVKVVSAFGSDRGLVVVGAEDTAFDILRFDGPGSRQVRDVRVVVASERTLAEDHPPSGGHVEVVKRDDRGARIDFGPTSAVDLTNPGEHDIRVRVVGIEYDSPAPGESQQFVRITRISDLVAIEPGKTVRVRLDSDVRRRFFGSIKAYASAPASAGRDRS